MTYIHEYITLWANKGTLESSAHMFARHVQITQTNCFDVHSKWHQIYHDDRFPMTRSVGKTRQAICEALRSGHLSCFLSMFSQTFHMCMYVSISYELPRNEINYSNVHSFHYYYTSTGMCNQLIHIHIPCIRVILNSQWPFDFHSLIFL